MIFNSLRINNYRAYYGESIFDFPTEGERNISILYADNDVGKSCFFSAVLFCLYGPKDSDNLKDLINVNAQSEKSYHAEVSLFVENGNVPFRRGVGKPLPITLVQKEVSGSGVTLFTESGK